MFKFKVGDEVKITVGKDKGKTGKIEKVLAREDKLVVTGVNVYKRHKKVSRSEPAGIYEINRPIDVSKITLICPKCQKLTKVGFVQDIKTKKRVCRKCKGVLS